MMIHSLEAQGFGNYTIYADGIIKNNIDGNIVTTFVEMDGYLRVRLKDDSGIVKKRYVHRLLAIAFLENPNSYEYVGHINGDKRDNRVENLFWYEKRETFRKI